jgi:hypothetical protein
MFTHYMSSNKEYILRIFNNTFFKFHCCDFVATIKLKRNSLIIWTHLLLIENHIFYFYCHVFLLTHVDILFPLLVLVKEVYRTITHGVNIFGMSRSSEFRGCNQCLSGKVPVSPWTWVLLLIELWEYHCIFLNNTIYCIYCNWCGMNFEVI